MVLRDSNVAGAVLPWHTFGPILAVHLFGTLGFSLAIPFLVFIVDDLGGATWTYGLLGATYSAFQLVGGPIAQAAVLSSSPARLVHSQPGCCSW